MRSKEKKKQRLHEFTPVQLKSKPKYTLIKKLLPNKLNDNYAFQKEKKTFSSGNQTITVLNSLNSPKIFEGGRSCRNSVHLKLGAESFCEA